jgi:two-component system, LytTR family, response regulator
MKPYRVLLADDEPPARRRLRSLLASEPEFRVAAECADGEEACARLASEEFELALLDLRMPGRGGLEVVRAVGAARMPAVVFVTAHDDQAVAAFELHALDYLLKPVEPACFRATLARVRSALEARATGEHVRRLEELLAEGARLPLPEPLVLRGRRRTLVLAAGEIEWVEAADNYLRLHLLQGEHLVRGTLAALERRLAAHGFLRIHRSRLVNPAAVRELRERPDGTVELRLRDGTRLVSARACARALVARWPSGLA